MTSRSEIEIADRRSRKRAIGFAVATLAFAALQPVEAPGFGNGAYAHGWRMYVWAFHVALLLLCVGTGGGVLNSTRIRALINDEVSRRNNAIACNAGFWVAMISGLIAFVLPGLQWLTGDEAVYIVVTLSTITAVGTFCWLEYRAHADA